MLDGDHTEHVVVGGRHVLLHRDAPAQWRVERAPQPVAARRIAHAAHGLLGILAAADHRKIDAERADIHRCLRKPWLVGGDPRQRDARRARGRRDHRMRRAEIDRTVLEVDDDPVQTRAGHDLRGLQAGDGRNGAEGRPFFLPKLAQAVERCGRRGRQMGNSVWRGVTVIARKLAARHDGEKINTRSRRNAAAEKRHQGPAQRMRPPGREDHFGSGMIGLAAGGAEQIRNPPGDRGGRIDPVDRPRRQPREAIQQQGIMGASQDDGIGAGGIGFAVPDEARRDLGCDRSVAHHFAAQRRFRQRGEIG